MKIHIDDKVLVIAGKYRGKSGKVIRIYEKKNKVVVEKINIRTRHIKKSQGQAGQRIQYEAPFDASNVMVVCPHCNKSTRVSRIMIETDGKKRRQRVCKKCNQALDPGRETKRATKKR